MCKIKSMHLLDHVMFSALKVYLSILIIYDVCFQYRFCVYFTCEKISKQKEYHWKFTVPIAKFDVTHN